jgi:hypothetical protein
MHRFLVCAAISGGAVLAVEAQSSKSKPAAETFRINYNVAADVGAAAGTGTIQIDQYTADADREAIRKALESGGHDAFLAALRKAPSVGTLTVAGRSATIRWAQQARSGTYKRTITVIADQPLLFVGGALVDAKPRAGYDVAVARFDIDDGGYTGAAGTMATAAKVKIDGTGSVEVADYASAPIKLVSVTRTSSSATPKR